MPCRMICSIAEGPNQGIVLRQVTFLSQRRITELTQKPLSEVSCFRNAKSQMTGQENTPDSVVYTKSVWAIPIPTSQLRHIHNNVSIQLSPEHMNNIRQLSYL